MVDDILNGGNEQSVLLVTTGTRGDVAPFIAYALELMKWGHSVTLLSNQDHASLALRFGVRFTAVAEEDWPQNSRKEEDFFASNILPGYRTVYECVVAELQAGRRPWIVSRTGNWGAQFAAERWGLPFRRIALQPCAIRQGGHPISLHDFQLLNPWRVEIGLVPLEFTGLIWEDTRDTLCFFPDWFGAPQRDWKECGTCADFMFLDEPDYTPDVDLERWLDVGPVPIVISTGSGMQDIEHFVALANVLAQMGQRVLFLSPYGAAWDHSFLQQVLVRNSVDHGFILPKSKLLIHNGGIGTTAQAIRARIPQIVVPLLYDQPDNAARVVALNLGHAVMNDSDLVRNVCAIVERDITVAVCQ